MFIHIHMHTHTYINICKSILLIQLSIWTVSVHPQRDNHDIIVFLGKDSELKFEPTKWGVKDIYFHILISIYKTIIKTFHNTFKYLWSTSTDTPLNAFKILAKLFFIQHYEVGAMVASFDRRENWGSESNTWQAEVKFNLQLF